MRLQGQRQAAVVLDHVRAERHRGKSCVRLRFALWAVRGLDRVGDKDALPLFAAAPHALPQAKVAVEPDRLRDELAAIDPDRLSPREALEKLYWLKSLLPVSGGELLD